MFTILHVIENHIFYFLESKTVYVAVRFSYGGDTQLFNQYFTLFRLIHSQNHSNGADLCTHLEYFIHETFLVIPEVKKLFKDVSLIFIFFLG